jgi:hypothetical protein
MDVVAGRTKRRRRAYARAGAIKGKEGRKEAGHGDAVRGQEHIEERISSRSEFRLQSCAREGKDTIRTRPPSINPFCHSVHQQSGVNQSRRGDGELSAGWVAGARVPDSQGQKRKHQAVGFVRISADMRGCVCGESRGWHPLLEEDGGRQKRRAIATEY